MLLRMCPYNGWSAQLQTLVTRLEIAAAQAKDQEAAAAMARELDAAEFEARVDREARRTLEPPDRGSAAGERSASDG